MALRWRSKSRTGSPGKLIGGRYRLEAPVAGGAMGTIWTAEHVRLRSRVAIKFLDASIADDPEMLERFLREAQSAAAVRGAHVVQIFDCGVERGDPYIAMELLQGEGLDERLARRGRITPAELNKIFSEVAIAVGNAHVLGVIHRDLKPGNIFIAREGQLEITKVLDFGIAKVMNDTLSLATGIGTRTGTLLGTPNYMSPEQARGSRALDQSTDLWSLAIIAFECLTGQHAFGGETLGDVVVQICTELPRVPSSLADVPEGFDQWFLKGASKDPAQRFSSAREMAEALREILTSGAEPATRTEGWGASAPLESGTLLSRSEPAVPTPAHGASPASLSLSLSPAQLAAVQEEPPPSVFGPLRRSASALGGALGSSLPLAWLGKLLSGWLAKLTAAPRTLELVGGPRRVLRRSGAALGPLAPLLAPLALAFGVAVVALWYGAARRSPDASKPSEPGSVDLVAGSARLDPAPREERPGVKEATSSALEPSALEPSRESALPSGPASNVGAAEEQLEVPRDARARRPSDVPAAPARVPAQPQANVEVPAARRRSTASSVPSNVAPSNVAPNNVPPRNVPPKAATPKTATPSKPADPFADRL